MRIDLHLHSSVSDGSLAPAELVAAASAAGLSVIALTDHDTPAGVPAAVAAAPPGLRVIPALEVSTTHSGRELHFLGYYVEPAGAVLASYARSAAERRRERVLGMIHRLVEMGVSVTWEEVAAAAGASRMVGRPHLARALVRRGHVQTVAEAFDRLLAEGAPGFLPTELLTPRAAVDLIHQAGGYAVWAHPPAEVFEREVRHFAGWGLDGVECFRPRTPPTESVLLQQTARALGLLVTGGSDWHGEWHGPLGEFSVPRESVAELLALGGL
ncbi:MAG: PHP domain-containing protein [Gemmatimonadetes bacterium]|nr:PHP domain-containing protein [Gemmatimonadota bacterium]